MRAPRIDPERHGRRARLMAGVTVAAFFALLWWAGCYDFVRSVTPPSEWKEDAFVLSGEFRADGTCAVLLDGQPLAPADDTTRTRYEHGGMSGAAPEGTGLHTLECGVSRPFDPATTVDSGNFLAWTSQPLEAGLAPGRYRVVPEGEVEMGDGTGFNATLRHPRFEEERASLTAYQGYVQILRADTTGVVGSFRVVARRKRRSPFT